MPYLLAGLLRCGFGGREVRLSLCFVLDGCTDDSQQVLIDARARTDVPIVIDSRIGQAAGNVGIARHRAMQLGIANVGCGDGALLLSTDADSVPRPDWIAAAIVALDDAEIATGLIQRREASANRLQDRLEAYYDRLYAIRRTIDPVPWESRQGHHFVGGANLAFRADAYAALGGFPPLPSGEDAALIDDACRAGMRIHRSREMVVETSSRRTGRTPGGLAAALRQLDRDGQIRVPDPANAIWQYRSQAAARRAFDHLSEATPLALLGARLGLPADHILGVARDCPNAQAFAMRVVPSAPMPARDIPLAEAEMLLAVIDPGETEQAA